MVVVSLLFVVAEKVDREVWHLEGEEFNQGSDVAPGSVQMTFPSCCKF